MRLELCCHHHAHHVRPARAHLRQRHRPRRLQRVRAPALPALPRQQVPGLPEPEPSMHVRSEPFDAQLEAGSER